MKKILFLATLLLSFHQMFAQSVVITESAGWLESAYIKWTPVTNATSYNVYYTGMGITNKQIDTQLIRSYGTYFRADIIGLAAGTYTIKVAPVISGVEATATTTGDITVLAHDRNGFAFQGGHIPSAYNMDGTPKTGAVILYITENNKNTVSMTVTGATANPCVGLQTILDGFKKGKDTRPLIVRFIGNITDLSYLTNGDLYISNANNATGSFTFEGVGDDAVTNGWSFCLKAAANVEIRNIAAMNNNSVNGDDFGLQQDNDHVWIHNNEMYYGNAGSDADQIKGDGAMDIKKSTYVTVSYNHFVDNGKCSLLGLSEGTTTGLYVTYHHNWFDHSDSRHPRVRFYSVHVYNNYYDGVAKYGAGSTMGSSLFVEGNYYRNSKHPMMTSLQGTDVWNPTTQKNDPTNQGTFSGEAGGTIKAFNNTFDASIGTNDMRFVAYGDPNPAFNIAGVISSTTDFDAYLAKTRDEQVPATVKSFSGGNTYNNFDTDASLYVKTLVPDAPDVAKTKTTQYAGRTNGGDIKWTFDNTVDDAAYLVNTPLKTLVSNYTTKMVYVQGETTNVNSQTLTTTSDNSQTVASGNAITDMVFTWGGSATDASVTGLPALGITVVKDATAKTITLSGIPTGNISFSVTTTGSSGTPVTLSGSISIQSSQTLTLTSANNSDQTVNSGTAITAIVFTWGGDATDATVTGLPASGLTFVKDATAKTITISGIPTATVNYSVSTVGTIGLVVTTSGTITMTVIPPANMVHNFTTSGTASSFYTITGNLSSGYGTANYLGISMTQCLKMESSTNIAFTTTNTGTLTLVFGSTYTGGVSVDGTTYTPSSGIVTVSIPAGAHTIKKVGTNYLFYMSVIYSSTAVESPVSSNLILYPNPVSNVLSIVSDENIRKIEIFTITGTMVYQQEGMIRNLDMSQWSRGSYLVKVTTAQSEIIKMILKK